ncbi:MAG: hypothetical protein KAI64_06755 [Thermoplasmata archaeon]|nr:hypothetical protein [Thermoplasmata archaeon]
MATNKTALDIISWFDEDITPNIGKHMEIIPHGGTALTLRDLKGGTKDVDFNINKREWFDEFSKILDAMGYEKKMVFVPKPDIEMNRYVSDKYTIDLVDIYYPTWNNWSVTETIRKRADVLRFGNLTVVLPDRDTIFLFKTYPCRAVDIEDLNRILSSEPLDTPYIKKLYEEQEALLRIRDDLDPVTSIVNMRTRFYLSLSTLKMMSGDDSLKSLHNFATKRFKALGMDMNREKLTGMINASSDLEWEKLLEKKHKEFTKILGL